MLVADNLDTDPGQFGQEIAAFALAEILSIASKPALVEVKEAQLEALPRRAYRAAQAAAEVRKLAGWDPEKASEWFRIAIAAYSATMRDAAASSHERTQG